jgi:hypothetical protein
MENSWAQDFSTVAMPSVSLGVLLYENARKTQVSVLRCHKLQVFV